MIDINSLLDKLNIVKRYGGDCNNCFGKCSECEYSLAIEEIESALYNYSYLMKSLEKGALLQKCDTDKYGKGIYEVGGDTYYTMGMPIVEVGD